MKHDAGIDLHGSNSVIVILDDEDRILYQHAFATSCRKSLRPLLPSVRPSRVLPWSRQITAIGWSMD
jgi:hypothetical protein